MITPLDKGVDILGGGIDLQSAGLQVPQNLFQANADFTGLVLVNHPAGAEHRRMRNAALYILPGHPAVERN